MLDTVEEYMPNENRWQMYGMTLNEKRSGVKAIVFQDKVFVIGGFDGINQLKSVVCFTPGAIRPVWHQVPDMNRRRSNFAVTTLEGKIFVSGNFSCFLLYSMTQFTQWTDTYLR